MQHHGDPTDALSHYRLATEEIYISGGRVRNSLQAQTVSDLSKQGYLLLLDYPLTLEAQQDGFGLSFGQVLPVIGSPRMHVPKGVLTPPVVAVSQQKKVGLPTWYH